MDTENIFDQMATRYDTEDRDKTAAIIAAAVRRELAGAQGKTALDYGCGTGVVGLKLAGDFKSMLLVDAAPQMIAQVQRKIETAHITNAATLCADFSIEIPPEVKADYILLCQVLLHVKEYAPLIERLRGMLNEGGHLIIVDFDLNENVAHSEVHSGFEQAGLIRLLRQIGFTTAKARTFYHGQKLFMNQDASLFLLDAQK